jgi:hypothetical protein
VRELAFLLMGIGIGVPLGAGLLTALVAWIGGRDE